MDKVNVIKELLESDKFNLALMDVAGKQYDPSFQNILQTVLKIKSVVDEKSNSIGINNPYQE